MQYSYIKSDQIQVFPAGLRGMQYNKSKFTTEDNLTLFAKMSANKDNYNHCYENPFDSSHVIIKLQGYYFNINKEAITTHASFTSNVYAAIRLVNKADNIGYVLGNVNPIVADALKPADQIYILDQGGASNYTFYGLCLLDEEALTAEMFYDTPENKDKYDTQLYSLKVAENGALLTHKLMFDSTEIRDRSSEFNIAEQFTGNVVKARYLTRSDLNIPVTFDNENYFGAYKVNINNAIDIKGILNIGLTAGLSTDGTGAIVLKSSGNAPATIIGPSDGEISLPNNTSSEKMVFIQNNGISNWLAYSASNTANTLVQRDGQDIKTLTLNSVYINGSNDNKGFIIKSPDNTTSQLSILGKLAISANAEVSISKDVEIAAEVDIDAPLHIGADSATAKGAVNISSSSNDATTIIGTGGGKVYLPNSESITATTYPYIWAQKKEGSGYVNSWIPVTSASKVASAIVMTDESGKINAEVSGEATKATTVKQISSTTNKSYPVLFTINTTSNEYISAYYNSGITINPSTKTITATTFSGTASYANQIKVTKSTTSADYPLIFIPAAKPTSGGNISASYADGSLTVNPNTGEFKAKIVTAATSITAPTISGTTKITTPKLEADAIHGPLTGNASSATEFSSNATVKLTGDVTGEASSKKGWTIATTIKDSGVTAGSYGLSAAATPGFGGTFNVPYVTVNKQGLITSASTFAVTIPATIAKYNTLGLVKPAYTSSQAAKFTTTAATNATTPTVAAKTTVSDRYYAVEADKDGRLFVNVPWVNTTYSVDAGGAEAAGGLKLVNNQLSHANAVSAKLSKSESDATLAWDGTFKIYEELYDEYGHITGITNTTKTLPGSIAKYNAKGLVMPAYSSTGAAKLTTAAATNTATPTIAAKTTTTGRYYGVETDKNGVLFVNVPWTDTTYTFSTKDPTLAWGTTSTIGTAGGVTYKVTMPANPNTDRAHSHEAGDGLEFADTARGGVTGTVTYKLKASGVTAGSYGNSANQTPGYGSTFNVPYITVDTYGRVTGISNTTVKIPASDNTNTAHKHTGNNGIVCDNTTATTSGEVNYKAALKDYTANTADSAKSTSTKGGLYAVELDKSGKLAVRVPWENTTYTFTDNNPTLAWETKSKVATVGGVDIHVTMPKNPNSDFKVTQTLTGTTNTSPRPLLVGMSWSDNTDPTTGFSTTTDSCYATHMAYIKPITGDIYTKGNFYSNGTAVSLNGHTHAAGDITSGTLAAARLPNATTSVKGAVIVGTGLSISSGTISLGTSGVTSGSYGPSTNASPNHSESFSVPYITVDTYGRVTAAATKTITMPDIYSLPTASSSTKGGVKVGTTLSISSAILNLATSGVTAGSYGPASNVDPGNNGTFSVPYITVDTYGRVTAAATKTITMPDPYSLPNASTTTKGGMKVGTNLTASSGTVSVVASPTFSGTVTAAYFDTSSDARLKTNFRNLEVNKSILDLPVYKFDYIDGRAKDVIGCKAQDLQEICPELVTENEDGYLAIHETKLVFLLLDEMKKLKAEIEELKNNK